MKLLTLLLLFFVACFVKGELTKCPEIEAMTNLNAEKLTGDWYFVKVFTTFEYNNKNCVKATIATNEDNKNEIDFTIFVNDLQKLPFTISLNQNEEANDKKSNNMIPLKFFATDYDNYLVMWGCDIQKNVVRGMGMVLSRNTSLAEDTFKLIEQDATISDIYSKTNVRQSPQRNCKY